MSGGRGHLKDPPEGSAPTSGLKGIVQPYLYEPLGRFTNPVDLLFHARQEGLLVGIRWESPASPERRYKVVEVHDSWFVAQALSVSTEGKWSYSNEAMYRISDAFALSLVNPAGSVAIDSRDEVDGVRLD